MEPRRAVINLPAMGSFQNSRIAERRGGSSLSSHTSVSLGFLCLPRVLLRLLPPPGLPLIVTSDACNAPPCCLQKPCASFTTWPPRSFSPLWLITPLCVTACSVFVSLTSISSLCRGQEPMADVALRSRDLLVSPRLSSWIMTPWHQFWLVHDFWRSEHRSSCTLLSHLHRSYLVF